MSYFDEFKKTTNPGIPTVAMNRPVTEVSKPGDVGIEFEIEATNSLPFGGIAINAGITKGVWQVKEDGSLRGGAEYITQGAVPVDAVEEMLVGLYRNLALYNSTLRFSNRCSTHVHLNASGWKINQVTSFLLLWGLLETVLIDWCGKNRKVNHFCLSMKETTSTLDKYTEYLKSGRWTFDGNDKYSALNLRRLHDLGSIEIRCGDAYPDPMKAVAWVKFLNALRVYASELKNPERIPGLVSEETPRGLFAAICENAGLTSFFEEVVSLQGEDSSSFDRTCYSSFRDVQHLSYFPWEDWQVEIEKEYVPNPFTKKVKPSPLETEFIQAARQRLEQTANRAFAPVPE